MSDQKMKIAIFHNFLDNIGGAEIVCLIMARELEADIYTTNIDKEKIAKMGFSSNNIFSIGRIPTNAPFRQEAAYWRFRHLNLGKRYDAYIIAGDWAVSASHNHHPNLWYVFSPMREIFDLYEFTRENTVVKWKRPIFDIWIKRRRKTITADAKKTDAIIAISKTVRQRVLDYFDMKSEIISPPIETSKYHYEKNGTFWLSVNRLINYKRIGMQVRAFAKMPEKRLIIVGSYEKASHFKAYANHIQKIITPNITLLHWVDNKTLIDLYAQCIGFITTSLYEDFGLTPLEAMASGKPVIAPNEGGYSETVQNGVTGKLIDGINEEKIMAAVKEIEQNLTGYKDACQMLAKDFDVSIFISRLKKSLKI